MQALMKHYKFAMLFAVAAIIVGYVIGGLQTALVVAVLGILETSLSFDNAVVNARVLNNWDDKWRQRFLWWGIIVAVFGMRLIFPLAIVSVTTGINPAAVTQMALHDPSAYAVHLNAVHHEVAGFGGAFLFMVALGYFFEEKQVYWWEMIESRLARLGQLDNFAAALVLAGSYAVSIFFADEHMGAQFFRAAVFGVVTFMLAHGLGSLLGGGDEEEEDAGTNVAGNIIKASIAGFFYLEILDASFSFDGVIGAFVLSNYLPVIALGLGIGAFFVRSMTIHLVEAGTLSEYRYLEHGAFYAILALAGIMYASGLGLDLPQWGTGLLSATFIAAAFLHSLVYNRREAASA